MKFCSKCFSTPVKVPCCIEDGKPGKIDPETGKCEEECDCDPSDPSAPKGVKVLYNASQCHFDFQSEVDEKLHVRTRLTPSRCPYGRNRRSMRMAKSVSGVQSKDHEKLLA